MKIALFFGSFNPVHLGHTNLGKYLIDNNILSTNAVVNEPTFQGYSKLHPYCHIDYR